MLRFAVSVLVYYSIPLYIVAMWMKKGLVAVIQNVGSTATGINVCNLYKSRPTMGYCQFESTSIYQFIVSCLKQSFYQFFADELLK